MKYLSSLLLSMTIIFSTYSSFAKEKILIVGDSEAGVVATQISKVKTSNDAVEYEYKNGSTIQYWMDGALQKALLSHTKPDTIIIFLGANNIGRQTTLDVSPILNQVKDMKCIWVGPPRIKGHKWLFNTLLKNFVETNSKCQYFNTEDTANITLPDQWHPTPDSAFRWLSLVWMTKNI